MLLLVSAIGSLTPATRPELFLSRDQLAGLDWLREQPEDSVVFSTFASGGVIAARTGRRVYIGHWIETPAFVIREAAVEAFFDDGFTDADRITLLNNSGIDYVWVDPAARELGDWPEGSVPFLQPAFESGPITIYEVVS